MDINVVRLGIDSVNDFWRMREELLIELEEINDKNKDFKLEEATKQYYLSHINKDLFCWGILHKNKLAAIGSMCLFERIPYEENLIGLEGYILNIYTSPAYRKQRYARSILDEIIKYSAEIGIQRLWLNSSEKGHSLYLSYGFTDKQNEMELFL